MNVPIDWKLTPDVKDSKQINEILTAEAKKLAIRISQSLSHQEKETAIYSFYRKYFTLTLKKNYLKTGINQAPARDFILDFPWQMLHLDRILCLQIWEKINH